MTFDEVRDIVDDYVMSHDVFWMNDIIQQNDFSVDSKEARYVARHCQALMKEGVLAPSDRKSNKIQYMRL